MILASDPFALKHAFLLPLVMGVSFLAVLFFGKRLPKKGSEIGLVAVGFCLLFSLFAGFQWIDRVNNPAETEHATAATTEHVEEGGEEAEHETVPVLTETTWFTSAGHDFKVGTFVDGLSVMMMIVVSTISLLVHWYSTEYVDGDRRYTHYFAFLSLFTASMLLLIMSRSTVQFITAWELVGVCSFALIGHWWEEKPNSDAALKAFLTNRVGDIGLLVGMITLFWASGSFDIGEINTFATGVTGGNDHTLMLVASLCLLGAVMSKSGQFILHTWLPDAMAGPTPVSALIHAATMVVAGIFMVARLYGVFFEGLSIGSANINALAVVGMITLLGGGGLAFVQTDIKKVLAYSTVSQLGYMAMALGVGAWTAAVFHLFTHAFFKAGLFLGSGSVAHSVHSFDMKKDMGGMRRFMPQTFKTFLVCSLALMAIPPLAGFWSKDEILAGASQLGGPGGYPIMLWGGILGGGMTAAYMTRCIYLTFFGEPQGHAADPHHPPHEHGKPILFPLYILSGLAVVAGLANLPGGGIFPDGMALRFEHYVEPVAAYFPSHELGFEHPHFSWWIAMVSTGWAVVAASVAYGYWFLGKAHGLTQRSKVLRGGYVLLENKYYFDHLYTGVIAGGVKGPIAKGAYWFNQNVLDGIVNGVATVVTATARWTYKYIDQGAVDGVLINGSGKASDGLGQALRQLQTGKVQQYGALLFGGAIVLAGIFVFAI